MGKRSTEEANLHYWAPPPGFVAAFEKACTDLSNQIRSDGGRAPKAAAYEQLGTSSAYWSHMKKGPTPQRQKQTSSTRIWTDIKAALAKTGPTTPKAQAWWVSSAAGLLATLQNEMGETASKSMPSNSVAAKNNLEDKDPSDVFAQSGRTTGKRQSWVADLLGAQAEWRDTNLAPGEGQWLQLKLTFGKSHYSERNDVSLGVSLRRLRVNVALDGGLAASRDGWEVHAATEEEKLKVWQIAAWESGYPAYEIKSPLKHALLTGSAGFFDLFEAKKTAGTAAHLEICADIDGLAIELPPNVLARIDPDVTSEYGGPEERLLKAWIRRRQIPDSLRGEAGMWRLYDIALVKSEP